VPELNERVRRLPLYLPFPSMEGRFYPAKPREPAGTTVTTRNLSLPAAETTRSRLDLIMLRCTVALAAMAARRAEPSRQRGSKFLSSSGIAWSHPQMTTFEGSSIPACALGMHWAIQITPPANGLIAGGCDQDDCGQEKRWATPVLIIPSPSRPHVSIDVLASRIVRSFPSPRGTQIRPRFSACEDAAIHLPLAISGSECGPNGI
jgi:hypothetical protein